MGFSKNSYNDPTGLQVSKPKETRTDNYRGEVFYNPNAANVRDRFAAYQVNRNFKKLEQTETYSANGRVFTATPNGWNMSKTALQGFPLGKPSDSGFGQGTPEDIVSNSKGYVVSALCSADTTLRNAAYALSPDYYKVSWSPGLFNVEGAISKDKRIYGGLGGNVGVAGQSAAAGDGGDGFMKDLRLRVMPQFQVGYFTNGVSDEYQRHDAMEGTSASVTVPAGPLSIGIDKSMPSNGQNFFATPTAIEIGSSGGGADITNSSEQVTGFSAWLRRQTAQSSVCQPRQ
jgi:hypothetical protein